jgi:hypothetical protein
MDELIGIMREIKDVLSTRQAQGVNAPRPMGSFSGRRQVKEEKEESAGIGSNLMKMSQGWLRQMMGE